MKLFYLILGSLVCIPAIAQKEKPGKEEKKNSLPLVQPAPVTVGPAVQHSVLGKATLMTTLSNGNKVYALAQDNIPCIVPDMSPFNMPNAATPVYPYEYKGPGQIPNPVSGVSSVTVIPEKKIP